MLLRGVHVRRKLGLELGMASRQSEVGWVWGGGRGGLKSFGQTPAPTVSFFNVQMATIIIQLQEQFAITVLHCACILGFRPFGYPDRLAKLI